MTALDAATTQARDARTQVARRLERAATQLQRQAAAVRLGADYRPELVTRELVGITEWVQVMDAHNAAVHRIQEYRHVG